MRSLIADPRVSPVENLVTNPSFKRVVPGSTIVRRNISTDPRLMGNPSPSRVTRQNIPGGGVRLVVTEVGVNPRVTLKEPINPGESTTLSFRTEELTGIGAGAAIVYRDAGNGALAVYNRNSSPAFQTSDGRWYIQAPPAPSGSTMVEVWVGFPSDTPIGNSGNFFDLLIETRKGTAAPPAPFFDGDTSDDTGMNYYWEGLPNFSASQAQAAVVEVRKNLCIDPKGTNAAAFSSHASSQHESVNGFPGETTTAIRSTRTNTGATRWLDIRIPPEQMPSVSQSVLVRFKIRSSVSMTVGVTARPEVITTANTVSLGSISLTAGIVNEFVSVGPSFAGVPGSVPGIVIAGIDGVVGDWIEVTDILVEDSATVLDYFNGDKTPDPDLLASWSGSNDASVSILYGIRMFHVDTVNGSGGTLVGWRCYDPQEGYYGRFEVIGKQGSYRYVRISPAAFTRLKSGGKVTFVARVKASNPNPTPQFAWGIRNGQGLPSAQNSREVINVDWHWIRVRVNLVEDGNGGLMVYIDGFNSADRRLDISKLQVVNGHYTGPYLDGDMPGCIWRGVPHASPSIGYPQLS